MSELQAFQHQQHHHHQLTILRMDLMKKRERKNKGTEEMKKLEQRLQVMDLSGMSLESLPKPSLDFATIYKLDLSNNNLQVHDFDP